MDEYLLLERSTNDRLLTNVKTLVYNHYKQMRSKIDWNRIIFTPSMNLKRSYEDYLTF